MTTELQVGSAARPIRILYAEDLADLRLIARLMLSPLGYRLECHEHGRLAWERLQAAPADFDLVITDHHMPVMNGLELVRALRTLPYRGKIIVFSSDLDPRTAELYRELRVDRILSKPVEPSVLRAMIAELFATSGDWPRSDAVVLAVEKS